jgi:putative solute:sodium symporter small subunit
MEPPPDEQPEQTAYWRANLRLLLGLLSVWSLVSFGLGIGFVTPLNTIQMAGFPLGFWFAHQGAIFIFVILIWIYAAWMDRIDHHHNVDH